MTGGVSVRDVDVSASQPALPNRKGRENRAVQISRKQKAALEAHHCPLVENAPSICKIQEMDGLVKDP